MSRHPGDPGLLDEVLAAADIVRRSGATHFEIGYLNDEPPYQWWATATYRGAKLTGEHPSDPGKAARRLAERILNGGICTTCGGTVTTRPSRRHKPPGLCAWSLEGDTWTAGCL